MQSTVVTALFYFWGIMFMINPGGGDNDCMCVHAYVSVCLCLYTYIRVCMDVCLGYVYVCLYVCAHMYICMCMAMCMCVLVCV